MFNLFSKKRKNKTPETFYVYVLKANGDLIDMKSFNNFDDASKYETQVSRNGRITRTNYR